MSQISCPEALDLLDKLVSERIPLLASLKTPSGVRMRALGFVEAATQAHGIVVCNTLPSVTADMFFVVPFVANGVERPCEFNYGEKHELDPVIAEMLPGEPEDSVLTLRFSDTGETLCLVFRI